MYVLHAWNQNECEGKFWNRKILFLMGNYRLFKKKKVWFSFFYTKQFQRSYISLSKKGNCIILQNERTFGLRGWNLQAQTRLFYIAIEIYRANNLGRNHLSFSTAKREAIEGLWSALPLRSGLFPRTASIQPDIREGSGSSCLHQEIEKLKAFNPYILGKSRWSLFAMTPKAIKTKIRVGVHLSFAFLAA